MAFKCLYALLFRPLRECMSYCGPNWGCWPVPDGGNVSVTARGSCSATADNLRADVGVVMLSSLVIGSHLAGVALQ